MKFINMRYLILLFFGMVIIGCSNEDLIDINDDPNNPTNVPAVNLVTQAEFALFDQLHGRNLNAEWGMLMVQQWAQNEYTEESRFNVDGNNFNASFQTFYASVLNELSLAKASIQEGSGLSDARRANQIAIVDILSAQAYQALTEGWGAIPYSQSLNSIDYPNPGYDSQDVIWAGILETYSSAVNSITTTEGSFDSGELIYKGDMTLWKKLGNSLMLRAAMRVSDVDPGLAQPYITAAAEDLISSNDENALFTFDTNPSIANPLWRDVALENRDDFCVTDLMIEWMKEENDPRLSIYADPTNSGEYVGMPYGLTDAAATALKGSTSRPDDIVRSEQSPHIIMDYANVQFFLAEAYERGLLSGDAAAAYEAGVRASMDFWGADSAEIDSYIAAHPYDAGSWKESIGIQKWAALYSNGYEAWSEWRRLDVPSLSAPDAAVQNSIPVRLPYPVSEQINNGTSLGAVTSTPDDMTTKLWWDVN